MQSKIIINSSGNKIQDFQLLKKQLENNNLSEEYYYNAFQDVLELLDSKDDIPNEINLRKEVLETLLIMQELHKAVYDKILDDYSTMIVKIIK